MPRYLQSLDGHAVAEAFNRFGDDYNFWMRHQSTHQTFAGLAKLISGKSLVLDVGCGEGLLALALSRVARRVVGVDLSPVMISQARLQMVQTARANVDFVVGDIQALGFAYDSFDLIVSNFALHHTDQQMTLPALVQLLRPGGWLYLQESVCPVSGRWKRHFWFRWHGLRASWEIANCQSIQTTWRVARFLQSQAWIQHKIEDHLWTPTLAQSLYPSLLPGCTVRFRSVPPSVAVLWQRPFATTPAISVVRSRARQRDTQLPDPAKNFTPIQVLRRYPRPAPDGYVPFPRTALDGSVVTRFEEQVLLHEHKIALRTANKALTYGALNVAANQLARRVLAFSESASAIVAILMDQDDDPVIPAILGVLKAGKAYAVIDPADSPEKQERYLALTGAVIAITTARRVEKLAWLAHSPHYLLVAEEVDGDSISDNLGLALGPDNLAALFFTSGSTGEPKYIARNHLQFLHSTWLNTNTYYVTMEDRQSLLYFPGFTASVPNIYDTLLNGATLCTLNPHHIPLCDLVEWLHRERITLFNPPIGLLRGLMDAVPPNTQWPYLRLITLAGQPISGKDIHDFQSRFGADTVLLHVLAMTEAGAITQGYIDHNTFAGDTAVPVGYPVADKEIVILGNDDMPLMVGEVGQIAVTSAYLSLGYWGDEVQTRQRYKQLSGDLGSRTFLTGDRGCLRPDGCLEYCGRNDFIVKVRGYRVDLAAVEAALNSHPELKSSAVVVRRRKDDEQSLIAYLVLASGTEIRIPELRTFLTKTLAHYMIPERFIRVVEMPLTANGKIDRRRLPHPTPIRPDMNTPFLASRNDLEQQVADIWAELLELDEVGIYDNFFELGGDSITALRVLLRIEERFGVTVPTVFFHNPTVAHLARLISPEANIRPVKIDFRTQPSSKPILKSNPWQFRLRNLLVQTGPIIRGRSLLPYGIGVRLQRTWIQQCIIHNMVFREQSLIFRRCLTDAGMVDVQDRYLMINLMANTWVSWRAQVLLQSPSACTRWIALKGAEQLQDSVNRGNGLIIVFVHQKFSTAVTKRLLLNHGIAETYAVTGAKIGSEISSQEVRRAQSAHHAIDLLRRGGGVFIAGEGRESTKPVQIPFYGRQLPIPRGFAELALHSKATIAAVFSDMSIDGRITLEFTLLPTPTTQIEAEDLVRHYGMMLVERWPKLLPTTVWGRQQYIQSLPATIANIG